MIVSIVENGANVAAADLGGPNAFHCAAKGGNLPKLSVLVAKIGNAKLRDLVASRDGHGRNALHFFLR